MRGGSWPAPCRLVARSRRLQSPILPIPDNLFLWTDADMRQTDHALPSQRAPRECDVLVIGFIER